jgi:hypothetical protein
MLLISFAATQAAPALLTPLDTTQVVLALITALTGIITVWLSGRNVKRAGAHADRAAMHAQSMTLKPPDSSRPSLG